MAELVKYVARQRFKYNGIWHKPGDEWQPVGGRYDNAIIRNRLVSTVRVEAPLSKPDKPAPVVKTAPEVEKSAPVRRNAKG